MTVVARTALVPHQPVPHRTRLAQAGSCETWEHQYAYTHCNDHDRRKHDRRK